MSYGQKSDSEMLLSYGFAPAALSNPHNACSLRLSLREDDPLFSVKRDLLSEADKDGYRDFPLRLDALPISLLNFADFITTSTPDKGVGSSTASASPSAVILNFCWSAVHLTLLDYCKALVVQCKT